MSSPTLTTQQFRTCCSLPPLPCPGHPAAGLRSFATLRRADRVLFNALARVAEPHLARGEFASIGVRAKRCAGELAGLYRYRVCATRKSPEVSPASLSSVITRSTALSEVANLAWAFAAVRRDDAPLFRALSRAVVEQMPSGRVDPGLPKPAWDDECHHAPQPTTKGHERRREGKCPSLFIHVL